MRTTGWFAVCMLLVLSMDGFRAVADDLEYPSALRDAYDADSSCWVGMSATGAYPVPVVPEKWLVGPPPSDRSCSSPPPRHD